MKKYFPLFNAYCVGYETCIPALDCFKTVRQDVPYSNSDPRQHSIKKKIPILTLVLALGCSTNIFAMSPYEDSSSEDLRAIVSLRQPNHCFKNSDFVNTVNFLNHSLDKKKQTNQEMKNMLYILDIVTQTSGTSTTNNFLKSLGECTGVSHNQVKKEFGATKLQSPPVAVEHLTPAQIELQKKITETLDFSARRSNSLTECPQGPTKIRLQKKLEEKDKQQPQKITPAPTQASSSMPIAMIPTFEEQEKKTTKKKKKKKKASTNTDIDISGMTSEQKLELANKYRKEEDSKGNQNFAGARKLYNALINDKKEKPEIRAHAHLKLAKMDRYGEGIPKNEPDYISALNHCEMAISLNASEKITAEAHYGAFMVEYMSKQLNYKSQKKHCTALVTKYKKHAKPNHWADAQLQLVNIAKNGLTGKPNYTEAAKLLKDLGKTPEKINASTRLLAIRTLVSLNGEEARKLYSDAINEGLLKETLLKDVDAEIIFVLGINAYNGWVSPNSKPNRPFALKCFEILTNDKNMFLDNEEEAQTNRKAQIKQEAQTYLIKVKNAMKLNDEQIDTPETPSKNSELSQKLLSEGSHKTDLPTAQEELKIDVKKATDSVSPLPTKPDMDEQKNPLPENTEAPSHQNSDAKENSQDVQQEAINAREHLQQWIDAQNKDKNKNKNKGKKQTIIPTYKEVSRTSTGANTLFTYQVTINKEKGEGTGTSVVKAKEAAAKNLLDILEGRIPKTKNTKKKNNQKEETQPRTTSTDTGIKDPKIEQSDENKKLPLTYYDLVVTLPPKNILPAPKKVGIKGLAKSSSPIQTPQQPGSIEEKKNLKNNLKTEGFFGKVKEKAEKIFERKENKRPEGKENQPPFEKNSRIVSYKKPKELPRHYIDNGKSYFPFSHVSRALQHSLFSNLTRDPAFSAWMPFSGYIPPYIPVQHTKCGPLVPATSMTPLLEHQGDRAKTHIEELTQGNLVLKNKIGEQEKTSLQIPTRSIPQQLKRERGRTVSAPPRILYK